MSARWVRNFIILVYFIVGGFVAWEHGYLGVGWLRTVGSGLLAILLWFLIPLGLTCTSTRPQLTSRISLRVIPAHRPPGVGVSVCRWADPTAHGRDPVRPKRVVLSGVPPTGE